MKSSICSNESELAMNAEILLSEFLRNAEECLKPPVGNMKKVKLNYVIEPHFDDDNRLKSIEIIYPTLNWKAVCGLDGVEIYAETQVNYQWADLPNKIDVPFDVRTNSKYDLREIVCHYPFCSTGPWSEFRCPGWFGGMLYNALLKAGKKQAKSS